MILSILILVLVGAVAFFHYIQGFFSAMLSAIITIFAAVLAVSYHEVLVATLLKGRFSDQANAIALIAIFALSYIVLRVLMDKLVSGNVQTSAIVDKIGAGVMGLIAGCFAMGVVALAAQSLPFGPSIGMFSTYEINDQRSVIIPGAQGRQSLDSIVIDEMKSPEFDPADRNSILLPVDSWLVGLTSHLSTGSMSGARSLESVHPDLLQELYGTRIGIQPGAKHTALNLEEGPAWVSVDAIYRINNARQIDAEIKDMRNLQLTPQIKVPDNELLLVVRTLFDKDATDADNLFRFSPGSIRLVANGQNYFPIGTMQEDGSRLMRNRMDDYLFVKVDGEARGADLVFRVPKEGVLGSGTQVQQLADGVFLEVKRLARVDLSAKKINNIEMKVPPETVPPSNKVAVLRKTSVISAAPVAAQNAPPPVIDQSSLPVAASRMETSNRLFTSINVQTPDSDVRDQTLASGEVSLTERKFSKLEITTTEAVARMNQGEYVVNEFYVPNGKVMVQIIAIPNGEGDAAWNWADRLGDFELVDGTGVRHSPAGAWAKVKQGTNDRMIASYRADASVMAMSRGEGRPTDVYIAFLVPRGMLIKELQFTQKTAFPINQPAQ